LFLNYIGKNYKDFRGEAMKQGISRNIPFNQARNLQWGETIVAAKWDPYSEKATIIPRENGGKGLHLHPLEGVVSDRKLGKARVLGKFKLTSLIFKDPELQAMVQADPKIQKNIIGYKDYTEGGQTPGVYIKRDCGSYNICASTSVDMPIKEIMKVAYEISEDLGLDRSVMIGGELDDIFVEGEEISDMPFSRGIIKLSEDQEEEIEHGKLLRIKGYRQYGSLKERELLRKNTRLDDFQEAK